ncbi:hypothetical protein GCM10009555_002130 [Acrocarpospora macrocephala]|uniref:Uncharacterized protein n=1 Tax=Acrocarpospora macrocephala TaxID=150177 RepID=A0A5M3X6N7_9ACTN|nr:hypothetical protein [Acrocarpospora macrocephala]GES16740.1 hypothetical protein Amac_103380 [Acrocarpospora macrocephala]
MAETGDGRPTPPPYVPPPPPPGMPPGMAGPMMMPPPPPKKSFRSTAIKLGAIGVLSTLVVGFCAAQDSYDEVDADCVDMSNPLPDGSYPLVDDDFCDDDYRRSHAAYGWYYGGVLVGRHVRGGSTLRPADAQITSRSGKVVQRGGFGSHGSSGS